jgi:hypothetical protein
MFIEEQQRGLTPLGNSAEQIMADVASDDSGEQDLDSVGDEVRQLLRNQRDFLAQAENNYRSYLQALGDLDLEQRRMLDAAREYKDFLDQNLLWIPSALSFEVGSSPRCLAEVICCARRFSARAHRRGCDSHAAIRSFDCCSLAACFDT